MTDHQDNSSSTESIVLGSGCFWCTEAIFQNLKGVVSVTSVYAGGKVDNPTYEEVCTGQTNHAEVIKIEFDAAIISISTILEVFFSTHDPTQLNQQGNDRGTQYRSIVLYNNENQKNTVLKVIQELNKQKIYDKPIVTEVKPLQEFYPAEEYHQNYFNNNTDKPYCQAIINPKLAKIRQKYQELVT